MSTKLNLVDRLLARGRKFQELGRDHDALHILERLAGFRQLPAEVAAETQARLAEIQLRRRKYLRARRHLAAALGYRPDSARYHYLMATAMDADDRGDPEQAAEHYRQSLSLEPAQPGCLADYGLLALDLGRVEEGLGALRRAAQLAPDDPEVVGQLVEGLCQEDAWDDARATLRAALFRNPRCDRFRRLWTDFQFQELYEAQAAARHARREDPEGGDGPTILPFVRRTAGAASAPMARKIIRQDSATPLPSPHPNRPARQRGQKHA